MTDTHTNVTDAPAGNQSAASCTPIREVLGLVGDKWSILVVALLEDGTRRFSELQRSIEFVAPISQRMLTRTLRGLERDGLLTRRIEATVPPSVYYTLTPLGKSLLAPVRGLIEWARVNYPAMEKTQGEFDGRSDN